MYDICNVCNMGHVCNRCVRCTLHDVDKSVLPCATWSRSVARVARRHQVRVTMYNVVKSLLPCTTWSRSATCCTTSSSPCYHVQRGQDLCNLGPAGSRQHMRNVHDKCHGHQCCCCYCCDNGNVVTSVTAIVNSNLDLDNACSNVRDKCNCNIVNACNICNCNIVNECNICNCNGVNECTMCNGNDCNIGNVNASTNSSGTWSGPRTGATWTSGTSWSGTWTSRGRGKCRC